MKDDRDSYELWCFIAELLLLGALAVVAALMAGHW